MIRLDHQDVARMIQGNHMKCYVCTNSDMSIDRSVYCLSQVVGSTIQNRMFKVILVTCNNCGNTMLFQVTKPHRL